MKRIVLTGGLIAGLVVSAFMLFAIALCYQTGKFEGSMLIGYASMILAFSTIFIGIKTYRDKYNDGVISFGKAFRIGLYITLIASTMYVVAWMIDYAFFVPDFLDKYNAAALDKLKAEGASATAVSEATKNMQQMTEMYKNPILRALFTYVEILPVGLLVSLIAALVLKRKNKSAVQPAVA